MVLPKLPWIQIGIAVAVVAIPMSAYWYGHHKGYEQAKEEWHVANVTGANKMAITEVHISDGFQAISMELRGRLEQQKEENNATDVKLEKDLAVNPVPGDCVVSDSVWNDTIDLYKRANAKLANGIAPTMPGVDPAH